MYTHTHTIAYTNIIPHTLLVVTVVNMFKQPSFRALRNSATAPNAQIDGHSKQIDGHTKVGPKHFVPCPRSDVRLMGVMVNSGSIMG